MGSSQLPTVESPPSSLSHILSLACYNCGSSTAIEEPADETMIRRASMSRRQEHIQSPPIRSRSTERYQPEPDVSKLSFNDDEDDANAPAVSAGSLEPPHHRRVFSDPFDTAEDLVQEEEEQPAPEVKPDPHALTTLPRFPVQETRNKNCWSQPPVDIFSVRGPRYFDDKKKVQSGPYLLQSRGCDLFLTDKPVKLLDKSKLILGGLLHAKPTLLVNFRFPWGHLILYFELPPKLAPYMNNATAPPMDPSLTAAERTLAQWLLGDQDYKNERLKLIPYVAEGPWVVRNMVTGRPAVIGKKLPVTYATQGHVLECTLDIGSSSATAKRIVSVCRRYMGALTVDIGFVIQAEEANELPEQMMGSVRVHKADPLKADKLT